MVSEFYFNLKETAIFRALKWSKTPAFSWASPLKKVFFILFFLTLIFFLYGFLTESFSYQTNQVFLGLNIIFLSFSVLLWLQVSFLNIKLKKPDLKISLAKAAKLSKKYNLAEFLTFDSAKACHKSIKFAKSKKLSEVNSTILLYYLLSDTPEFNFVFSRLLLNLNDLKKLLKENLERLPKGDKKFTENYSEDFKETILEALKIAQKNGHQRIRVGGILIALAKYNPILEKLLIELHLRVADIEHLIWWLESLEKKIEERKKWWEYRNLMKKGTLAKEWTAGYTITLDQYSTNWTEIGRRRGFPEIIGHRAEIEETERILARREYNNVLLVGEPGVGRKAIVQGLVLKTVFGESLPQVNYKRVVELDLPGLLAETSTSYEVEVVLDKIFQEVVQAGNVILVIDEFHNFVGVKPGPGRVDISGVLSSYLHLPQFQIVAITTFRGLHRNLEQNPSILNLFAKVEVSEPAESEVLLILENLALVLEQRYKLFVSYPALRQIINLSRRFLPYRPFPKKAVDLLDEIMIYVKRGTRDKVVLPKHVAKIISRKTQVPVGEMEVKEKETLLNLEKLIHQRIINQEQAVKEVSTALRRARAEVTSRSGPMGTFLFLGPTGVGKTETSKALAEIYFGAEARMIRLDMSEFQQVSDIPRLIGSPGEEGLLTTKVREDPFSLVLLDEIEKAHPNILNLFLQVLDEGSLTDGLGRKVDFKNTIIISTSNAGYKIILQALKEKGDWSEVKQKLLDYLFEEAIFRPEFINRFDAVVVFQPLSRKNLLGIAELMLQKLKKNLKEKGIDFEITLPLKEKIVEIGYDPTFGAREMRRVIQDKVENILAHAILSGELKRGDKIKIDPQEFKIVKK
jgi:ATP-dependent Clp protease ATP-binding subunit ClpC